MSDWTAGYVADIDYTFGYYPDLNPLRVKLAFLNAGLAAPEMGSACDLGFGQGMSANLHAAASVTHWHGTDFNPAQAIFAQDLAQASGAQVHRRVCMTRRLTPLPIEQIYLSSTSLACTEFGAGYRKTTVM